MRLTHVNKAESLSNKHSILIREGLIIKLYNSVRGTSLHYKIKAIMNNWTLPNSIYPDGNKLIIE